MGERPRRGSGTRLLSVGIALVMGWTLVGYRLTVVQGARAEEFAARGLDQRLQHRTLPADRGTIFDRDGRELAVSVESVSVYANPLEMPDPARVASLLSPLVGRDLSSLLADFTDGSAFVYVARQMDPADAAPIRDADLPGVYFLAEPKRVYPTGALAAHVVGFVREDDNVGLEGLELQYDEALTGRPGELLVERDPAGRVIPQGEYQVVPAEPGSDLVLTVKTEIQYAAEGALRQALERTGARSGTVVVLDPETGEVLAMVTLPSYDPNDRDGVDEDAVRTRAVTDVFEPGSTQKLVTISAALEAGLVAPSTMFAIPSEIQIQDTVFTDSTIHDSTLSVADIVANSSNLGTILVGDLLGARLLHTFMTAFGEGSVTGIDFPGESAGSLRPPEDWCPTTCLAGTSIGYHVAVTPIQMAAVYGAIANDGVWVRPHLVREIVDGSGVRTPQQAEERRVVSQTTAVEMREMLARVVEQGTGSLAAVPGYRVGGKTGTTEIYLATAQEYSSDQVVASFIGMAPIADPKVVVVVVLDSPVEYASGGQGAAPVFSAVMLAALNQLGVPPDAR